MDNRNPHHPPRPPQQPRPQRPSQGGKYHRNSGSQQHGHTVSYETYSRQSRKNAAQKKKTYHEDIKGDMSEKQFNKTITDDENLYLHNEANVAQANEKIVMVRKIIVTLVFMLAALGLNMLTFRLPFAPAILTVDLSPLPELIVCLAVHPIAAAAIIFAKNGLYFLFSHNAWPNLPGKIILDLLFVIAVWMLFQRLIDSPRFKQNNDIREMAGVPLRDYSIPVTIICGLFGSAVTAITSVFTFRYITMPLLEIKTKEQGIDVSTLIYEYYRSAYSQLAERVAFVRNLLPTLDNMKAGVVVYNIPISFIKYFLCTVLAAFIFPFIRDFIARAREKQ